MTEVFRGHGRDSLPDGRVWLGTGSEPTWDPGNPDPGYKGEDMNLNGIRDQDANGDWTETDFLANDSDVDGVLDGAEVFGTYCFKEGTVSGDPCANTGHPLDPLNPDTDGDGLRDGQELAGWTVGIWYERTMEKRENYSVSSDPWQTNSDGDTLTDFSEFMNGSDPRSVDTDGDGITDTQEIARHSNITGIEGTPPQIANVSLNIGIVAGDWTTLYLPKSATVTVAFDVSDNVGLSTVTVKLIRMGGRVVDTRVHNFARDDPASYTVSTHIQDVFEIGFFDALVAGADVNITAFDVNENGASGDFHVDSVLEAIAKAIAAFLSAVVDVIVEAISAAVGWVLDALSSVFEAIIDPIFNAISSSIKEMVTGFLEMLDGIITGNANEVLSGISDAFFALFGDLFTIFFALVVAVQVGLLLVLIVTGGFEAIVEPLLQSIEGMVIGLLISTAISYIAGPLLQAIENFDPDVISGYISDAVGLGRTEADTIGTIVESGLIGFAFFSFMKGQKAKNIAETNGQRFSALANLRVLLIARTGGTAVLLSLPLLGRASLAFAVASNIEQKKVAGFAEYLIDQAGALVTALAAFLFSHVAYLFHLVQTKAQDVFLKGVAFFYGLWSAYYDRKADEIVRNYGLQEVTGTISDVVKLVSYGSLVSSGLEFVMALKSFHDDPLGGTD